MKNWPNRQPTLREALHLWISKKLIHFASCIPKVNRGPLSILQWFGDDRFSSRVNIARPNNVDIDIGAITFYDLIPVEGWDKLERGLTALHSKCRSRHAGISEERRIPDFFVGARQSRHGDSWVNVGCLDFQQLRNPTPYLGQGELYLLNIAPSFVAVMLVIEPTAAFRLKYSSLTTSNITGVRLVHGFGRRGRWASTGKMPSQVRHDQLEGLFLEINKQLVMLFRKYVRVGRGEYGPLETIETYFTNVDLIQSRPHTEYEFWRSLFLSQLPHCNYTDQKGVIIFPPDSFDHKGRALRPYRIVVNRGQFNSAQGAAAIGTSERAILHQLEFTIMPAMVTNLAVRREYELIANRASELRENLAISFTSRNRINSFLSFIRRLFSGVVWLNQINFVLSRISGEFTEETLSSFEPLGISRPNTPNNNTGRTDLGEDLRWQISYLRKYARSQTDFMQGSVRDLWNYHVQCLLIFLAIMSFIVALTQLAPAAPRKMAIKIRSIIERSEYFVANICKWDTNIKLPGEH